MERTIKLSDLQQRVDKAYEKYLDRDKGEVSPLLPDADASKFAISVVLTDGTVIEKGDVSQSFALGNLAKIPTFALLLQQNSVKDLMRKLKTKGACKSGGADACKAMADLPVCPMFVREVSAVEPVGDRDGRMDIMTSNISAMTGSDAVLDDALYGRLTGAVKDAGEVNAFADNDFELYDEAGLALDQTVRLQTLTVTATQLAAMGATIAADGVNPSTGNAAFDGSLSQYIVAMMAALGPSRCRNAKWLIRAGAPAMASFSGGFLAVVPGFGAVAAYSPKLHHGFSHRAAHAVRNILTKLDINVFASARVKVEK